MVPYQSISFENKDDAWHFSSHIVTMRFLATNMQKTAEKRGKKKLGL